MFTPYPQSRIPRRPRVEDPNDLRMGFFVQTPEGHHLKDFVDQIGENDIVLLGYADDRGVDRNGGRTGANEGPDEIRKILYAMTPGFDSTQKKLRIWDLGNLKSWSFSLLEAHEEARKIISSIRRRGARIVSLGGGHDWAYPDFVDFSTHFEDKVTQLINFDSHLDMRPIPEDVDKQGHSGTPFRRILTHSQRAGNRAQLAVFGLQKHCNADGHIKWAQGQRAVLQFLEELPENLSEQWELLKSRAELDTQKLIGLSIDLDVFDAAHAPGVSAPQAFGLHPRTTLKLIDEHADQIKHFGIYEYNPRYDLDAKTARLAAKLIHHWLTKIATAI